jgi:ketosteroid isomerase-like protein
MRSEALAVIQAFLDTLTAAGDFARASDSLDPDVVGFGTRGGLDELQVLRGRDAVLKYLREVREHWERYEVEPEQLIEAGDSVVAFLRETAHARRGGVEVHIDTAIVFKMRQQKIVELTGYLDRTEALRAVGAAT